MNFYVIEKGEVEVLRHAAGVNEEKVVAVLGPGDFFGEMSLLEKRPHSASVRARTLVRVIMLGDQSFSQLSGSMTMLKQMVGTAAKRRSAGVWDQVPAAQASLENEPLVSFLEPVPAPPLTPDATYFQAIERFNRQVLDVCYVCDAQGSLVGVLTHRDLFNAIQNGADASTPVSRIMTASPVALTKADTTAAVVMTMREHTLRWIPIVENSTHRKLAGYIRAEKLLERVVKLNQRPVPSTVPTTIPS
jgi:signal-transduction protein with cAMP-binding, CBS, and nucleotidyltransferase domain